MASEFTLPEPASTAAPLRVVDRSVRPSLEGRLRGTIFARTIPTISLVLLMLWAGETATVAFSPSWGIAVHAFTLISMITLVPFIARLNAPLSKLLVAMLPVPLIRIVSLTSPLLDFYYLQWFTILAVIVYVGIATSVKILKPSLASLGLRFPKREHLMLEIAVAVTGFGLGIIEFFILRPNPLVANYSWRALVAPILIMFLSTGLLEELLFRGLILKYAREAMGDWPGIMFTTAVFATMHIGWNSILDIFFVASVGFFYAMVVRRTGSIVGVSISHAITNSMLFLILPLVPGI